MAYPKVPKSVKALDSMSIKMLAPAGLGSDAAFDLRPPCALLAANVLQKDIPNVTGRIGDILHLASRPP